MSRIIGLSTGTLHKTGLHPVDTDVVETCLNLGCNAIELNIHSFLMHAGFLNSYPFEDFLKINGKKFKHISVHLPCDITYTALKTPKSEDPQIQRKRFLETFNDNNTYFLLYCAEEFSKKNNTAYFLVHPDLVESWDDFYDFKITIAIENMDNRKKRFQYENDLLDFFAQHPQFKFVLDVNHLISNNHSISSIKRFIKMFSDRLVGVHLSGFQEYHEPLFKTKQFHLIEELIDLPKNIPIIIESVFEDIWEAEHELAYVKNILG